MPEVWRTFKGQTAKSSLDVETALRDGTGVAPHCTLIDILACASIGGECVARGWAGAVETPRGVGAAVGAHMTSSRQCTLINIFTCYPINVTQLVTTATVTLVGAIDIGTLLAARVGLTLIDIVTVSAIVRQFEAGCAAALVGPLCVLTLVGAQSSRIMPALIDIFTHFGDGVEEETDSALTAVRAHQVDATMVTTHIACTTFIYVFTTCAILSKMIASSTGDCVPATGVRAHCVDTSLAREAWSGMGHTLVYINTAANGILNESVRALFLWVTAE